MRKSVAIFALPNKRTLHPPLLHNEKNFKVNENEKTLHGFILNGGSYTVGGLKSFSWRNFVEKWKLE